MAFSIKNNKAGMSIIEVLVVIGIAAILILSVGKVLSSLEAMKRAGETRSKTNLLAQEPLEIINDMKNELFACVSPIGATCTRPSDGQTCDKTPPYNSCWTDYPKDQVGQTRFYLERTGTAWTLRALGADPETVASDPGYRREIVIENIQRDANGDIAPSGTFDPNSKRVRVTVWQESPFPSAPVSVSLLLTAWKSL
jgi:type II secretory pathway pseudopilin PulG